MGDGGIGAVGAADAGAADAGGGGKGGGDMGGGDPFGMTGGDPLGMGMGDFGGFGGFGSSAASPGGNIAEVAQATGDPTGAAQAQQSLQAGAPSPGTPGGGIGGAQTGREAMPQMAQNLTPQTPTPLSRPTTAPTAAAAAAPPQAADTGAPSDSSGDLSQSQFDQRFSGEAPANFNQRFPSGQQPWTLGDLSRQQLAQSGMAGVTAGQYPEAAGTPGAAPSNVPTPTPRPAQAPTGAAAVDTPTTPAPPDTGAAPDATGGGQAATPSPRAPSAPRGAAAAPSTPADTGAPTDGQQGGGAPGGGGGGRGGMGGLNPMQLIQALLRGGPQGLLSELAHEAMGGGMQSPLQGLPTGPGQTGGYYPQPPEPPSTSTTPSSAAATPSGGPTPADVAAGEGVAPTATGLPQDQNQPASFGERFTGMTPQEQAQAAGQPPAQPGAAVGRAPPPEGWTPAPSPGQASADPQSQTPNPAATEGMPGGMTGSNQANPPTQGYGQSPNQNNRPYRYGGKISVGGKQFGFATGGGRYGSLPYGRYHVHMGAIGPIGRRIGAIAGVSDSNSPGDNTVHDAKFGRARNGIEIHPANGYTNGCIGVNRRDWPQFSSALRQAASQGPVDLVIRPDGSASIENSFGRSAAGAQAAGTRGWGPPPTPPANVPGGGIGGLPQEQYTRRLFQIESGGNPRSVTGSNRGLGQFGPEEERRYGITPRNRNNPAVQARAVAQEAREHSQAFSRTMGRNPTAGELYLMHQQGQAGGLALHRADPNTPAWQAVRRFYPNDAVAQRAIRGNIPGNDPLRNVPANRITAGQFRQMWSNRFNGGGAQRAGVESLRGITETTSQLAPEGLPTETYRRSENVETGPQSQATALSNRADQLLEREKFRNMSGRYFDPVSQQAPLSTSAMARQLGITNIDDLVRQLLQQGGAQ